jgi:hypothetical protein
VHVGQRRSQRVSGPRRLDDAVPNGDEREQRVVGVGDRRRVVGIRFSSGLPDMLLLTQFLGSRSNNRRRQQSSAARVAGYRSDSVSVRSLEVAEFQGRNPGLFIARPIG